MNTKEAIAHLKKQGWVVNKQPNGTFYAERIGYKLGSSYNYTMEKDGWKLDCVPAKVDYITARELIHLAKSHSNLPRSNTVHNSILKGASERGSQRAKVRRILATHDEDRIDDEFGVQLKKDNDKDRA
jgi:hypothetical protein